MTNRRSWMVLACLLAVGLVICCGLLRYGRHVGRTKEEIVGKVHDNDRSLAVGVEGVSLLPDVSGEALEAKGSMAVVDEVSALKELTELEPHEILKAKFNSYTISCDFGDREVVRQVLNEIPIKSSCHATAEQIQVLKDTVLDMLIANGQASSRAYVDRRLQTHAVVSKADIKRSRSELAERGFSEAELPSDPCELVCKWLDHEARVVGEWAGLAKGDSVVTIRESQSPDLGEPGLGFRLILRGRHSFGYRLQDPRSVDDVIAAEGKVMVADVTVFIKHREEDDGEYAGTLPYVLTYWYDKTDSAWRPYKACLYRYKGDGMSVFITEVVKQNETVPFLN